MKNALALLLAICLLVTLPGCAPAAGNADPSPEPAAQTPAQNSGPVPSPDPAEQAAAPAEVTTPAPAPTPVTFPTKGYCNGEGVNLREEPSTTGKIIDIMGQNALLDVMALQDGWYKINLGGVTAYVAEKLITLGEPPRPDNMRWAKISAAESQLYKSPVDSDVSDVKLKKGDVVKVLRAIDEYLHVVYMGNLQRYVKATDVAFISAEEALTAMETADADAQ